MFKQKSPYQKMELIAKIAKGITEEIDQYYAREIVDFKEHPQLLDKIPDLKNNKFVLDADQLLLITIYIMLQSKIAFVELYSHLNMIYEFSTDSQKLSQFGFAVSSMEVCLESMLTDDQINTAINNERASFEF